MTKCKTHGTEMTSHRGGDPECTECFLVALKSMPKGKGGEVTIEREEAHGKWVINGVKNF